MKRLHQFSVLLTASAILFASCSKDGGYGSNPTPTPTINKTEVKAAGDLTAALAQFRSLIGDSLNTTPNKTSGRREINWDGVPANFTNANNFPFDFFNNTDPAGPNGRKRGLVYSNTGTSFRIDSSAFADIDASYAAEFRAFSPKKLFAYIGNNVTELTFRVAGTNTDAFVKGFGLIFSDVDDASSTTVEYFNGTKSLGIFKVPVRNDANGFSFLGVHFPDEKVSRVKITAGNGLLANAAKDISQGGTKDLVAMDDFFYSEPLALQ